MKKISILFIILFFAIAGNEALAQESGEFSVKAQVRPRFEYNHGAILPLGENDDPTAFISNRARLSMAYDNGFLSMGVAGQEISVWGEKAQIENRGNFAINEAWVKLDRNGYFAQIGRQVLAYDDDRILGTLDWHQAGRWHDALKLGYENEAHRLHVILAYNQTSTTPRQGTYYQGGGQPYKLMQTGHYLYRGRRNFTASVLAMNLGFQAGTNDEPKINYMQTLGTNLAYAVNALDLQGTFYYQMGKTALGLNLSAFMFAAKAQYKFTPLFSAAAGLDYLSGNRSNSEKFTAFNPLYGTHHKFYGAMDYFYASTYPNVGLIDGYASLIFRPMNKFTIDVTCHYFASEQPINVDGESKKSLGSEIDLTLTYPIRSYITLQGGYSTMFGSDAFFVVKSGNKERFQSWMFVSLNVNPTLFKSRF